ncbi:MAG: prepilin-type N-terminal cleavage/methylation domain-containing protein [Acidobacteria bacterium]|nr:prepilin-type N-terminal cleavage/methylation domain-containing protein [Acidobacteriota bacterium]
MKRTNRGQAGYTLAEALVVVAIIGLVSLVTIPNFVGYMRGQRVKNAAREFVMDLREARQTAISEYHPTKIAFESGTDKRTYRLFDGVYDTSADGGIAWTEVGQTEMFETVYFGTTTFPDSADTDDYLDIIFLTNGSVSMPSVESTLQVRTDLDVARPIYTVTVSRSGRIRME